jgi:hypothetical protein
MLRFKNIGKTNNTQPIFGFHHICLLNNGADIFREQLETLISSGLYSATTQIFCSVVGAGSDVFELPDKYKIVYQSEYTSTGERKILEYMYASSNVHIGSYWYIHTKGVSHFGKETYNNVKDWRVMMEYFLITKWLNCYNALTNVDIVGVNLLLAAFLVGRQDPTINLTVGPHFSGNFWWTRSNYVSTHPPTFPQDDYLSPEMWICQRLSPKRILCIFDSKLYYNHSVNAYPPELYKYVLFNSEKIYVV